VDRIDLGCRASHRDEGKACQNEESHYQNRLLASHRLTAQRTLVWPNPLG